MIGSKNSIIIISMKKLFTILLFLLSFVGFSQSGDGYVNYTSYRTQCNSGCLFTRVINGTTVWVNGHMNNIGEFIGIYDGWFRYWSISFE